jgi:hypothetical protein
MLSSDMSLQAVIAQLSHGNAGAAEVLAQILKQRADGIDRVFDLDISGIRGEIIWKFYKDGCGSDINVLCEALRNQDLNTR